MTSKTKTSTIPSSYIDFEPYCERKKEGSVETLVFHLTDFEKDQLRVQVNNLGVLKVSGEKSTADGTKTSRFCKEIKIPQGCDINDIRAKFSGGQLHVTMPTKVTTPVQHQQKPEKSAGTPEADVTQMLAPGAENLKDPSSGNGGLGSSLGRLQLHNKVTLSLGVAVAAMVAIGTYVAFRYGSSSSPPPHIED